MQIDCYGFEASSQWFRRKELEVYRMKEVEGILYLCYGNQPMRPIHRIDHDGARDTTDAARHGATALTHVGQSNTEAQREIYDPKIDFRSCTEGVDLAY